MIHVYVLGCGCICRQGKGWGGMGGGLGVGSGWVKVREGLLMQRRASGGWARASVG